MEECKSKFLSDAISFVGAQTDRIAHQVGSDEFQVWCPCCNCPLQVNGLTPRLQFVNGQTIFFRCYECVHCFMKEPTKFFTCPKPLQLGEHKREMTPEEKAKLSPEEKAKMERCEQRGTHGTHTGTHVAHGTGGTDTKLADVKAALKQIPEGIKEMLSKPESWHAGRHHHSFHLDQKDETMDRESCLCPADGHEVKLHPDNEFFAELLNGQRLYFCTEGCVNAFCDNPVNYLMTPKAYNEHYAELVNNMDGFTLGCPICEAGKRMVISSTTPRLYFNYGQLLFFDRLECMESFCFGAKKYIHKCPMKKRKGVERKKKGEFGQEVVSPVASAETEVPMKLPASDIGVKEPRDIFSKEHAKDIHPAKETRSDVPSAQPQSGLMP
jgi:YHS domain-containing protein